MGGDQLGIRTHIVPRFRYLFVSQCMVVGVFRSGEIFFYKNLY